MLRKSILAAGMLLALTAGAWAEFTVDNFMAVAKGQDVQFAITAHNPGDVSQQGPIKIKVYSSTDGRNWSELQSFNLENLDAGAGWSQKFTVSGEGAKALKAKDYEAKMVIEMPGDEKTVDKWEDYARVIIERK